MKSVVQMVDEIKRCEAAGAITAALAMCFVCIDTMTFLGLPAGNHRQTRLDFIAWVDAYLVGHEDQLYAYRGLDAYGARCALLHTFSSDAYFHRQESDAKKFGYHDGGKHAYNPDVSPGFVIIGIASFINDVVVAVGNFVENWKHDDDLRARVAARLPRVLEIFPIASEAA